MSGWKWAARALASLAITVTSPVSARIPTALFEKLDLNGLRLGMTLSAVEAFMHARDDIDMPSADYTDDYDCAYLKSDTLPARPANWEAPTAVDTYSFAVASGGYYSFHFYQLPSGLVTDRISYREDRKGGSWPQYLAEAESRFGKADYVHESTGSSKDIEVGWCRATSEPCITNDYRSVDMVTLTYSPHDPDQLEEGDLLTFELSAGRDTMSDRDDREVALARSGSPQGKRIINQCRRRMAMVWPDSERDRRLVALIGDGMEDKPIFWNWKQVPRGIFNAMGVDAAKEFAPGRCLATHTVLLIEDNGCTGYSSIRFKWARRMGSSWVIATELAGRFARPRYFVLVPRAAGAFELVWQGMISELAAWKKAGSRPLPTTRLDAR